MAIADTRSFGWFAAPDMFVVVHGARKADLKVRGSYAAAADQMVDWRSRHAVDEVEIMQHAPPPSVPDPTPLSVRRVAQIVLRASNLAIHRPGVVWPEVIVDGASWLAASLKVQAEAAATG